jgi:hypothetical protein
MYPQSTFSSRSSRSSTSRRAATSIGALVLVLLAALSVGPSGRPATATHDCGLPDASPLWIEFGAGSVPSEVRAVFARPGVVVSGSGAALPADYRAKGAATTFFVLNLPQYVGQPATPADPATVVPEADQLYQAAVASTACARPWIALNELLGPTAATPWSPTTTQYRANVLALVQRLADRGARPALLVHGDPNVAGDAGAWWASVGRYATIVYESYYNAVNIRQLGPVIGNRRMRLGMRSMVRRFAGVGVPAERLGFMMGFHVALGTGGREGLQPREEWLRVVKWEALTARQIARDERIPTIWSWGWATFGPPSADPDKPAAACVYLWARDPALCDGPAVAGTAFNASLEEGQIVLPTGVHCRFPGGTVRESAVLAVKRLTRNRHSAVTAAFARAVLERRARVTAAEVVRAEAAVVARAFRGSRTAYVRALTRRRATLAIARGILTDELRRQKIVRLARNARLAPLAWASELTSAAANGATCMRDDLPGYGDFPRVNELDVNVVPLPALVPFLRADRKPPAAPRSLVVTRETGTTKAIVLDWADGPEADLAGYRVFRSLVPGGPYTELTRTTIVRSTFRDATVPAEATPYYIVRAFDTSANRGGNSAEASLPPE